MIESANSLIWGHLTAAFILFFIIGLCPGPSFASLFLYCPRDRWGGLKLTIAGLPFLVFMTVISLVASGFTVELTYWIFIVCCVLSVLFLMQMIYYVFFSVFREIRLDLVGKSSFSEISHYHSEHQDKNILGPWYFGTVTSWFNGYYYSIVLPLMIAYAVTYFKPAMDSQQSFLTQFPLPVAYIIYTLLVTIALYLPFCILFTIYGLIIHESADFFGSRFVLITNMINLVFLSFLLIDALIKLILGPVLYLDASHQILFCNYAMSNGYLFHNIPLLDFVF